MEVIREKIIERHGKLKSAIEFENLLPDSFLKVIEEMKNASALVCFFIDPKDCSNIVFNPYNENDKVMMATLVARSFTAFDFISEVFGLARLMRKQNFDI